MAGVIWNQKYTMFEVAFFHVSTKTTCKGWLYEHAEADVLLPPMQV